VVETNAFGRFRDTETASRPVNGAESRASPALIRDNRRDLTAWLGRQDSNLGMAESKSDHFSFEINTHSEKIAKFDPLSTNRLTVDSECGHTTNIRHLWFDISDNGSTGRRAINLRLKN